MAIWDHPHACGDKRYAGSELPKLSGSSPRVWGQVFFFFCPVSCAGIIPTRMGTRTSSQSPETQEKDHPHAYGDKEKLFILLLIELGSSPRVWGQGACVPCHPRHMGIIPTRMGTSQLYSSTTVITSDHPHAYGDKVRTSFYVLFVAGSSPRVWGQDNYFQRQCVLCRIIPTRMGTRFLTQHTLSYYQDHPHAYGDKRVK